MGAITPHSIMETLEKKTISYNLEKDLRPITMVGPELRHSCSAPWRCRPPSRAD
jgi:hypothetical protein